MPGSGDGYPLDETVLAAPLMEREVEILHLLAQGLSNREIARDLSLALETVKWYNKRIYSKLEVANRNQAVAQAQSLGLLDTGRDAGASTATATLPKHNLPAAVTSFVGRQQEIRDARRLLAQVRLLSIAGPAGCGKTRLALRLASEMVPHFQDGVCFVPLAPLVEVDKLLWAIAERLGVQFHAGDEPLGQLLGYLRERALLLVLDNFEHLLAGAGLINKILQIAPGIKILVTSRERLNLYGEMIYRLNGLALPGREAPDAALRSEAVELFLQRARSVDPGRELAPDDIDQAVHICRLVEGMPLAIELAATWMDVLSPGEIAGEIERSLDILTTELRDAPSSQKSMRAAIARSWALLDDEQQAAFRRLSIFRGGFTRDAAQAVARLGFRMLQTLVGKSLLQYDQESERYQIHELLRHYAKEQLEIAGEFSAMDEAHAVYFAGFMAERWPQMKGRRQKQALREIEADLENARAAWGYWIRQQNVPALKEFLHSFWVIHDVRGWYPTGIELFAQVAAVMRVQSGDEAGAGLGWLLAVQGLYRTAGEISSREGFALAQEGVEILTRLQRCQEMVVPLISLFITATQVSEREVAAEAAATCLAIATATGDRWGVAKAKQLQAILAIRDGQVERAEHLGHEALAIFEEIGDNWSTSAVSIEILGQLAIMSHHFSTAKAWIERGLEAAHDTDFRYSQQMAYLQLGYIEALQENYADAGRYWQRALEIGERVVGAECFIGFGVISLAEWSGRKLIPGPDGLSQGV